MFMKASTEVRKFHGTWLRECCRQVEAEVISNSTSKLHQTTYRVSHLLADLGWVDLYLGSYQS